MRIGRVIYLLGRVLVILGLSLLLPLACALIYREPDWTAFALCAPLVAGAGMAMILLCRRHRRQTMRQRESFLFVTASWLVAGLVGAIPYLLAGSFGDLASALFESFSGFSTTGASAMTDIEIMPHGILFWRSLTHWLGGAGIVLLFIALIQQDNSGEGGAVFKAEFSGGALAERVAPRIEDNAQAIFTVYLALTLACLLALLLAGMDFFDALCHSLATVSTGGFSTKNLSIGAYNSPAIEWVVAIFLFLSSINFALYYIAFARRRLKKACADQELRWYLGAVLVATALVLAPLLRGGVMDWNDGLRHAFFQVTAIMSTGGFCTVDFDLWPNTSRLVLFVLMFVGGCAGSTASSIKMNRWYLATRASISELTRVFRPTGVFSVYYNGRIVSEGVLRSLTHYFYMYLALTFAGAFLLTLTGMDWIESFSGALASISNVGPAHGSLGPAGNYAAVPAFGKLVLSFLMLLGRLELYTVLVLLVPALWRK